MSHIKVGDRLFPLPGDYLSRPLLREMLEYAQSIGGVPLVLPAGQVLIDYDLLHALLDWSDIGRVQRDPRHH